MHLQYIFFFTVFKKHISCKYVVIFEVWCNMKAVQRTQIVHNAKRRFSFFHSLMQECYYGVYFTSYWYYLHHSSYRCPFYALDPIDVLLYSRVTESFESYHWIRWDYWGTILYQVLCKHTNKQIVNISMQVWVYQIKC